MHKTFVYRFFFIVSSVIFYKVESSGLDPEILKILCSNYSESEILFKKIKKNTPQKNYRDKIKEAREIFKKYDLFFFKEWRSEIFQSVKLADHVEKLMSYHQITLDKDYPNFNKQLSIKKSLISFCKQQISIKKYRLKIART